MRFWIPGSAPVAFTIILSVEREKVRSGNGCRGPHGCFVLRNGIGIEFDTSANDCRNYSLIQGCARVLTGNFVY